MSAMLNTITGTFQKHLVLALVVMAIGVPVNYYLYSSWQKVDAVTSMASSDIIFDSNSLSLLDENTANSMGERNNDMSMDDVVVSEFEKSIEQQSAVESLAVVKTSNEKQETAVEHAGKHADPKYICPMHSEIITDDPNATCPICGMDLVVLESLGEADVVELSSTIMNVLGVRTKKVKRRTIYRRIDSVGYVTHDEQKIRRVSLRTEGWVEKLNVKTVGERVEHGDLLFQVYSPKLVNAQEEFLQALENSAGDDAITKPSRERLRALGISRIQIERLKETKLVEQLISIYAPQDGVVMELNIREGAFVPPSTSVVSLVDLSSVWLMVDIFESQIDWVKKGQSAEAKLSFMPDKIWEGQVEYVYPMVDPKTRSVKARVRFDNVGETLKPNMFAAVTIFAKPRRKVLTVPREAVIRTGTQTRVIVAQGGGRFKPAIVHTGIETDSKVEIIGGLEEGQEVVVSSQFLIDSESSMRAALLRLAGG